MTSHELAECLMALRNLTVTPPGWVKPSILDLANRLGLSVNNRLTDAGHAALNAYLKEQQEQPSSGNHKI